MLKITAGAISKDMFSCAQLEALLVAVQQLPCSNSKESLSFPHNAHHKPVSPPFDSFHHQKCDFRTCVPLVSRPPPLKAKAAKAAKEKQNEKNKDEEYDPEHPQII